MSSENPAERARHTASATEKCFTVESANEALVFVRRVVKDVVAAYAELMCLRAERQDLSLATDSREALDDLRAGIERTAERLRRLDRELRHVGCELKDLSEGLVDFPALFEGRKVLLCWKLGEPEVAYWHELRAGFAGRRRIDGEFRLAVAGVSSLETETISPA